MTVTNRGPYRYDPAKGPTAPDVIKVGRRRQPPQALIVEIAKEGFRIGDAASAGVGAAA
jgi:hypothetical protein